MKNKKGFTLIESLAAVIIISIFLCVVVPSITKYLKRGTVEYYRSIENELKSSGMDYLETYRTLLPREIGNVTVIQLDELVNNKYIDVIKDEEGKKCKGQVTAKKVDSGTYEYYSCLKCGNSYQSKDEVCDYSELDNKYKDQDNYKIVLPKEKYIVGQCEEFNLPFGQVYYNNQLFIENLKGIPSEIDTDILGTTEVIYYYHGVKEFVTVEVIDKTKPSKPEVVLKKITEKGEIGETYLSDTWYSGNIYQKFKSTDYTKPGVLGSGIDKYQISKDGNNFNDLSGDNQIDEEDGRHTYYVKSIDKAGNESAVNNYTIQIDKESPICELTETSGTLGKDNWYTSNVTIGFNDTTKDTVSGLVFESIDITSITSNTSSTTASGIVIDKAGNVGACSITVKVDKTTPNPPIIASNDNITSGNWHKSNTTLTFSGASNISGNTYYYGTGSNPSTEALNSSYTQTVETGATLYYVKVCSGAGLCSSNTSYVMKLDKTAPSCPTATGGSTIWTNGNRIISYGCNDTVNGVEGSGCKTGYSGGSKTFNTTTKIGTISQYEIKDNAGNSATCPAQSVDVYVDKTAPSCPPATGGSTTWTNNNRVISYGCNDTVNGVEGSGCKSGNSGGSKTFDTTTQTDIIPEYEIKDNVGNSTTCSAQSVNVYVDKTKPSCPPATGGSTTWTNNDRVISYGCSDSNSGCKSGNSGGSKTFDTTKKTATISEYTIKDNAGNSTTCPAQSVNVYVDKTKPSCPPATGGSTTWTKNDRVISYGCSDSNSGCKSGNSGGSKTFDTTKKTATISEYTIKDNAGNSTTCPEQSVDVYVDKTKPAAPTVALINSSGSELSDNTWYNVNIYVAGKADSNNRKPSSTDSHSGIKKYQISKTNESDSWDDWNYSSSSSTYKITSEGTTYRYIRAVDNAGNISPVTTKTIKIDKTPPVISHLCTILQNQGDSNCPDQTLGTNDTKKSVFTVNDSYSGILYIYRSHCVKANTAQGNSCNNNYGAYNRLYNYIYATQLEHDNKTVKMDVYYPKANDPYPLFMGTSFDASLEVEYAFLAVDYAGNQSTIFQATK